MKIVLVLFCFIVTHYFFICNDSNLHTLIAYCMKFDSHGAINTVQPERNARTKFSYNQFANLVAFGLHVNLARIWPNWLKTKFSPGVSFWLYCTPIQKDLHGKQRMVRNSTHFFNAPRLRETIVDKVCLM